MAKTALMDTILPFELKNYNIRGRFVRMSLAVDAIIKGHEYPDIINRRLGEIAILSAALASGLKADGIYTLQARGDGALTTIMADYSSDGTVRAYADYDEQAIVEFMAEDFVSGKVQPMPINKLMGTGHLVFTTDPGKGMKRYQGIVPLQGWTLTEAVNDYYRQSEQLRTFIRSAVEKGEDGNWQAVALMFQGLPGGANDDMMMMPTEDGDDSHLGPWRKISTRLAPVRNPALFEKAADPVAFLKEYFEDADLRVFDESRPAKGCRCSEEKARRALQGISKDQLVDMSEAGALKVDCHFCGAAYTFSLQDLGVPAS